MLAWMAQRLIFFLVPPPPSRVWPWHLRHPPFCAVAAATVLGAADSPSLVDSSWASGGSRPSRRRWWRCRGLWQRCGGSSSVVLERWQRRRGVVATAGETGKRLAGAMRAARRCGEGQQACLDSMRAEERSWESLWSRVWRLERERGDEEDR